MKEVQIGENMMRKLLEERTYSRMESIIDETERLLSQFACDDTVCHVVMKEWRGLVKKNYKGSPVVSKVTVFEKKGKKQGQYNKQHLSGRPSTAKVVKRSTVFDREGKVALTRLKEEFKVPSGLLTERSTPYYTTPVKQPAFDVGLISGGFPLLDGGLSQPRKYSKPALSMTPSHPRLISSSSGSDGCSDPSAPSSQAAKRFFKRRVSQRRKTPPTHHPASTVSELSDDDLGHISSSAFLNYELDGGNDMDIAKPMQRPPSRSSASPQPAELDFMVNNQIEDEFKNEPMDEFVAVSSDEEVEAQRVKLLQILAEPCAANLYFVGS
eukprot:TRINITY_DN19262_c0_g1_i1.p1 TRINITY_DN19262_c0_g1~~TRINITY_DN19262_c0_g1_i1.p1  ORF type:complete len:343 (+),score=59.37 TRINITY_DN19262_c0_g1_i1:57-1031(+)